MTDCLELPGTVKHLCKIAGVSVRTLQYAFEEEYSISPKSRMKARTLNQVRKQLRTSHPEKVGVADVANDWGICHLGHVCQRLSSTLRGIAL